MRGRFEELMERLRELGPDGGAGVPAARAGCTALATRSSVCARRAFSSLRHRVRPWQAVPALVAAIALIVGGFWLGGAIGGHASAATLVRTLTGKVLTKNGDPLREDARHDGEGQRQDGPHPGPYGALPADTVISGTTIAVPINKTVPVTIATTVKQTTVNHTTTTTVVQTLTVTGPTTTVQGPTQTVTDTITITLPGTTVTLPATS